MRVGMSHPSLPGNPDQAHIPRETDRTEIGDQWTFVFKDNPSEAKYALLTRAAELGHPGAKLAIERAREKFQELQQQREFQQQQQQLMLQLFGHFMQGISH
jgi:hypothetical protein